MIPRQILLAALILSLAIGLGQAASNLTLSHQVCPDQIWPAGSEKGATVGRVTLTVTGESQPKTMPLEVVLAIDSSASMTETDPSNKRLDAARGFVMKMDPTKDRVGLVSWNEGIDFSMPPTENFAQVLEAIGRVDSDKGTNLDRGLKGAIDLLTANSTAGSDGSAKFVILLSDGDGDYTQSGRRGSQADRARDEGVVIYSIGLMLADSQARKSLEDMAETTGGRYYEACNGSALESIYEAIGEEVINLLGRDVVVMYTLPREVEAFGYSVPTTSETLEEGKKILTWEAGDISAGETWSTSFDVSSKSTGIFELGGTGSEVAYKRRSGFVESLKIEWVLLDVAELRSGASTKVNLDFNLSALGEIIKPVHEVAEEDDSHILWRFSECNCGCTRDWAFLSKDGTIVVTSLRPFSLGTRDALSEDIERVLDIIGATGANVSDYNKSTARNSAEYYAKDAGIYHQIKYSFGSDFDLTLVVPDCTVKEARLAVIGNEMDYFAGVADQEYYIDGDYVTGCEYHDFPWNGYCTAEDADITEKIWPGDRRISARKVSDPHTLIIEIITTSKPQKEFFLYSDDYKSVWVPATSNALRSPEEMLSISSGTLA
ncbi:MAG TPA: VWA domain-containing protein [Methanotrichaceae archaeon]|nr:VWA domain-containing protein [Methanotrichaceae archaeon]